MSNELEKNKDGRTVCAKCKSEINLPCPEHQWYQARCSCGLVFLTKPVSATDTLEKKS